MYDPLIEIRHKDSSKSYVRASEIVSIRNWIEEKMVKCKNNNFIHVTNINEILNLVNEIENRNELANLMK